MILIAEFRPARVFERKAGRVRHKATEPSDRRRDIVLVTRAHGTKTKNQRVAYTELNADNRRIAGRATIRVRPQSS